jgi:ubiquitin-conjugating enzyme (huntingtin interacting protein 2)
MATTRERRIAKELADIHNDKDNSGVLAHPVNPADLTHLKGTFPGPPDTPYAGGTFQIDIVIPDMYPFKSPLMKFDTKIWHPNVSSVTVSRGGAGQPGVFLGSGGPFPQTLEDSLS